MNVSETNRREILESTSQRVDKPNIYMLKGENGNIFADSYNIFNTWKN